MPQFNHIPSKPKCCYCEVEHWIECKTFKLDKAKYKLKRADIVQNYKDKIIWKAKKDNILINEATFADNQQGSTYSVEQA